MVAVGIGGIGAYVSMMDLPAVNVTFVMGRLGSARLGQAFRVD